MTILTPHLYLFLLITKSRAARWATIKHRYILYILYLVPNENFKSKVQPEEELGSEEDWITNSEGSDYEGSEDDDE